MPTLLRIDASARSAGSHTRALADHFQVRWQARYPTGRVIGRSLADEPVPHLSDETIAAFHHASQSPSAAIRAQASWFNGCPGLLVFADDRLATALTLEIDQGVIRRIFAVRNPEKLGAFS